MIAFLIAPEACFSQQNKSHKSMETSSVKQFSLLVRVPVTYTTAQAKAAGPEWDDLIQKWKDKGVYVLSFAFPGQSAVVGGNGEITNEWIVSDGLRVVSNLVLQAPSIKEACDLAGECPIIKYGGNVEVREIPVKLNVTLH
jgi:hypothetical protein